MTKLINITNQYQVFHLLNIGIFSKFSLFILWFLGVVAQRQHIG